MKPRILIADDHQPMLDHLVRMLAGEFDVVAAVGDGGAALAEAVRLGPDLLILDISMPVMGGIAVASRLQALGSVAKVVFITMYRGREFVQESLALGTVGMVAKERLASDLVPAIRSLLAGRPFVSQSLVE